MKDIIINKFLASVRLSMLNGVDSLDEDMLKKELKENLQKRFELEDKLKEVREYITSYESIDTIQQNEHSENNKDLDEKTLNEMVRRYMIVHDKLLEILDKENNNEDN